MAAVFVLITVATAALGGRWTSRGLEWYRGLTQPPWAPPDKAFGPAWTLLYVLMTAAVWLVWRDHGWGVAVWLWVVQMGLNALWPWFFFARRRLPAAFTWICLLWVGVGLATGAFWAFTPIAGILMLPYLGWVTFAGALSFYIWQANAPTRGPR